jgi:tol-pal system protein YbgF
MLLGTSCAQAGPAEDALARTAELQKTMQAQQERIAHLESQAQNQNVISLLNQIEALKAEVARLRGFQEEQAYQMDVAEKRVKDLFVDLDLRLNQVKELANRPAPAQSDAVRLQTAQSLARVPASPAAAPDSDAELRVYGAAQALVKSGKYKEAVQALRSFLDQYPGGTLAPNAVYWMGFSQVNLGDFPGAANSYQKLIDDYPSSPKAPDAMLSLARARLQTNEQVSARTTLEQLIAKYPASKAAVAGKKLLATLN